MKIPKIIHQVWSGVNEPLPKFFDKLGETWKECHPDWKYELWDNSKMNAFVKEFYPQYTKIYNDFRYNIQRWDAIRYLILGKLGGMYVDFDTECLRNFNDLLDDKTCCFSMEYPEVYGKEFYFNNALMASAPNHPFMELIIERVFSYNKAEFTSKSKGYEVIHTTGPLVLIELYEKFIDKDSVFLIPTELVSPLLKKEVVSIIKGNRSPELEFKLQNAYSIHYFFNTWLKGVNIDT